MNRMRKFEIATKTQFLWESYILFALSSPSWDKWTILLRCEESTIQPYCPPQPGYGVNYSCKHQTAKVNIIQLGFFLAIFVISWFFIPRKWVFVTNPVSSQPDVVDLWYLKLNKKFCNIKLTKFKILKVARIYGGKR